VWDFARGYAALRGGNSSNARKHQQRLSTIARTTTEKYRFHPASHVLQPLAYILDGEISRAAGDLGAAIASFEKAVEHEDMMGYDEPEPLPFATRHWLGAALVEAGKFDTAAAVYRAELADHPHNGWSLFGLQQALAGAGAGDPAVDEDLARSWARADTWIRASRF
ncbi:MAG: hypothetical protein KJO31_01340, partial [Gammaproteobacteria bacterium]|nr:hypothetical protein [Gammaproteobacteria bacterium]